MEGVDSVGKTYSTAYNGYFHNIITNSITSEGQLSAFLNGPYYLTVPTTNGINFGFWDGTNDSYKGRLQITSSQINAYYPIYATSLHLSDTFYPSSIVSTGTISSGLQSMTGGGLTLFYNVDNGWTIQNSNGMSMINQKWTATSETGIVQGNNAFNSIIFGEKTQNNCYTFYGRSLGTSGIDNYTSDSPNTSDILCIIPGYKESTETLGTITYDIGGISNNKTHYFLDNVETKFNLTGGGLTLTHNTDGTYLIQNQNGLRMISQDWTATTESGISTSDNAFNLITFGEPLQNNSYKFYGRSLGTSSSGYTTSSTNTTDILEIIPGYKGTTETFGCITYDVGGISNNKLHYFADSVETAGTIKIGGNVTLANNTSTYGGCVIADNTGLLSVSTTIGRYFIYEANSLAPYTTTAAGSTWVPIKLGTGTSFTAGPPFTIDTTTYYCITVPTGTFEMVGQCDFQLSVGQTNNCRVGFQQFTNTSGINLTTPGTTPTSLCFSGFSGLVQANTMNFKTLLTTLNGSYLVFYVLCTTAATLTSTISLHLRFNQLV